MKTRYLHSITLIVLGSAAVMASLAILDVEDVQEFLTYFTLIPLSVICFGIAIWIIVSDLRDS